MKIVINRILNAACVQGLRFGLCFQTARADGNTSEVYRRLIDDQVLGGHSRTTVDPGVTDLDPLGIEE
jgi:hypothetical protein